jgi:hypothetical protein
LEDGEVFYIQWPDWGWGVMATEGGSMKAVFCITGPVIAYLRRKEDDDNIKSHHKISL